MKEDKLSQFSASLILCNFIKIVCCDDSYICEITSFIYTKIVHIEICVSLRVYVYCVCTYSSSIYKYSLNLRCVKHGNLWQICDVYAVSTKFEAVI